MYWSIQLVLWSWFLKNKDLEFKIKGSFRAAFFYGTVFKRSNLNLYKSIRVNSCSSWQKINP